MHSAHSAHSAIKYYRPWSKFSWLFLASLCTSLGAAGCGGGGSEGGADAGTADGSIPGSDKVVTRAITVGVGDLVLEGVLSIPEHAEGVRLPGIVLVHGTGPASREETARGQEGLSFNFELAVFHELADLLVARGYAVLRYDKRSCNSFNGHCSNQYPTPTRNYDVNDFIADGAKVADFLATQPEIDPARVAVAGHSQGGALIPGILTASTGTAAGVSIAGPWSTLDIVARWQYDQELLRLRTAGATQAQIDADQELQDLGDLATALEALMKGQAWTGDRFGSEQFWRTWLDMDLARPALAAALGRPVLAVSGDYDWNVGTAETQAWADAGVGTAVILPGITHLLNFISQPDYTKLKASDIGQHVDPSVSNAIADFMDTAMP